MGDVNLMRGVVQLMLEDKMPSPLSSCAEINIFSLTSFGSDSLINHKKERLGGPRVAGMLPLLFEYLFVIQLSSSCGHQALFMHHIIRLMRKVLA